MNKLAAILLVVIGVMFGFILMPTYMDNLEDFRAADESDNFTFSTGVGVTTASLTLTRPLYRDSTGEVTSITSNVGADAPVAATYASSTQVLGITGLSANVSHLLTVEYLYSKLSSYGGLDGFAAISPLVIVFGLLALILMAIWFAFKRG